MELSLERRESSRATCPLCREEVEGAERVACACGVEYHPACRAELAGCVTLGCAAATTEPVVARRGCCRCGEPVRTRPVACEECGERHHAWCRSRRCGEHEPAPSAPRPSAPTPPAPARTRDPVRPVAQSDWRTFTLCVSGVALSVLALLALLGGYIAATGTPDEVGEHFRLMAYVAGVVGSLSVASGVSAWLTSPGAPPRDRS